MPVEGLLPLCPRAIATSRPGREAWALEEILDAIAVDPEGRVEETRFRGVYAIYSSLPPCRLAGLVLSWDYSFVKSIIIGRVCAPCEEARRAVLDELSRCPGSVRLLARARGECKGVLGPGRMLGEAGVREYRGSRHVLAVESVGTRVVVVCGVAVERPYGALVVVPRECKD